jgi:hypothetical protein
MQYVLSSSSTFGNERRESYFVFVIFVCPFSGYDGGTCG